MDTDFTKHCWRGWPHRESGGWVVPFGTHPQVLNINFQSPRAELVSTLMQACLKPDPERDDAEPTWDGREVWSWTLAQRLQALLAIAQASNVHTLSSRQPCRACGEESQFDIDITNFIRHETVTHFNWRISPEQTCTVMLPTGTSQQRWEQEPEIDRQQMAEALITDRDARTAITAECVKRLESALEEQDPLTALDLEVRCPACEASTLVPFDLERELLFRLHQIQKQVLGDVHRLAMSYHWSEASILEIPSWRRRHYLQCCQQAGVA